MSDFPICYYPSASAYVSEATDLKDKISRIEMVIDALLTNAMDAAGKSNIEEYQLNDGQTIIKTVYRSTADVASAIADFEKIKQMYINRLNGRTFKFIDRNSICNG